MGTKVAVAFANIFMAKVETELLKKSAIKPICWKRYIDDIFSLWGTGREQITLNKQIITAPLLNSQQKSLRKKSHFWIQLCTKANGLTVRQFSTYERILNLLKLSNIHISRLATH